MVDSKGGERMVSRLWHGRTTRENADAYEALLRTKVLPGINILPGYEGAYLLRQNVEDGVEFVSMTFFDSPEAAQRFAGAAHDGVVIPPDARPLLIELAAPAAALSAC
jgi:hypothetical protein